jgi:F0F1-type ATP synthase delta subunit
VGGMNINKFNAYLSLNNSASEIVKNFDINKSIVVDDFTEIINDTVDYITRDDEVDNGITEYTTKGGKKVKRKNKKTDWSINRDKKDIPFDFMDGAGICLSNVFSKNTQIRLPWFKGLLCPVNYKKYIEEHEECSTKVKDIYGKEYDIIEDDIQVIFTKSQFKMWKFYKDWEEYKSYFNKYECTCNKCMEDEDKLKDMRINYQMLQTLTEMSDEEIEYLTKDVKQLVNEVHTSKEKQLEFLGATLETKRRDYMQEIIRLYPEILTSKYIKKQLSDTITSFKQEAMSGRIKLHAKRTFIIPDLVHFMSLLFGDGKDYALDKNEVFFDTYKDSKKLALLRSPHLSREWCLRNNTSNEKTKYFKTNGIYVSAKDLAYLVLMFDVDGDEALVVDSGEGQEWLINLAEKQMADLVPLYYEMGGGEGKIINPVNIFNSLKFVYEKSNIGKVSNTLTNIWSKDDYKSNMDNIKKLCAYNNWIIDSAKKLELPKLPKDIRQLMNNKLYPYFFQFAKGKKINECRAIGNGVIDRICKSINNIKNSNFDYSKGFGKFMLNKLLHNKKIEINYEVVDFYLKLEEKTRKLINQYATKYKEEDSDFNYKELAYSQAREDILQYSKGMEVDYLDLVDMIIKYAFKEDEMKLAFIFNVFGAVIINNLNINLELSLDNENVIMCECCGKRFKLKTPNSPQKYCDKCAKEIKKEMNKQNMKKYRMCGKK